MGARIARAHARQRSRFFATARHPGHSLSASRVDVFAIDSIRSPTRSYSQVAKAIGRGPAPAAPLPALALPTRSRSAIPCHRVVREDGSMGGYRCGIERKKALLEMERQS